MDSKLFTEAEILGAYLIGSKPSPVSMGRYAKIVRAYPPLPGNEQAILEYICKHPRRTGFIDAGLALRNPDSLVRKRIHTMFAILEADPEYAKLFLPQKYNGAAYIKLAYSLVLAALSGLIGLVLIGFIKK